MSSPADGWKELEKIVQVLTTMSIPYVVGGSLASSYHGRPRSTNDADVMVAPFPGREREFASHYEADYYLSIPAVIEANLLRRSFNIINTSTGFKIDIFIQKSRAFDSALFERSIAAHIEEVPATYALLSAEDSILLKLEWYRLGMESSDRQWADILGVLQSQADHLDGEYLTNWAEQLQVLDLLQRAYKAPKPT